MIFLLDENETEQRLRSLALGTSDQQVAEAISPGEVRMAYHSLKRTVKSDTLIRSALQISGARNR